MNPKRIQRKRTKGWRMPDNAIYVGRGSDWGNPFKSVPFLFLFREYATWRLCCQPSWLEPLRGHDLACWCQLDKPCHADILIELANK